MNDLVESSPVDTRHDTRLAALPSLYKTTLERLACELAFALEPPEETFQRYNYSIEQAAVLLEMPSFVKLLDRVTTEVREAGLTFRAKARIMAEELLPQAFEMATDPYCSGAVRMDAIKWSAKMGDLEPKQKDEGKGVGGGLTLSITFAGQAPQQVVGGREPVTIEQTE